MKNILILSLFLFIGCSASQEATEAKFQVRMSNIATNTSSQFPGGLILYGVSGDKAFSRVLASEIQDEIIPNGIWDFYVIGWDGAAPDYDPMTGKVFCGIAQGVNLNGVATLVELSATNSNCSNSIFGQSKIVSGEVKFPKIKIKTCNDLTGINSASTCQYNYDYSALPPSYVNKKGTALSYKIFAQSFNRANEDYQAVPGQVFESSCIAVDETLNATNGKLAAGAAFGDNGLNIPPGKLGTSFTFHLRAYLGSDDCHNSYAFKDIPMIRGASPNHADAKTFYDSPNHTNTIYAKSTIEEVCSSSQNSVSVNGAIIAPFKGGKGKPGAPYILCSARDLNEINHNYASTESFILGKDLDMNPLTAVFDPINAPPCAEEGANFLPIGGILTGDNAICTDYITKYGSLGAMIQFSGTFDGNFKEIKGLRLTGDEDYEVGFIRNLSGHLINTRFKNLEFRGKERVGLVGYAAASARIFDIIIDDIEVGAKTDTTVAELGSVVGLSDGAMLANVHVRQGEVRADKGGNYVGGIVGKMGSGSMQDVFFDGRIDSHNSTVGIGGIAGYQGGNITNAKSSGFIHTGGTEVGGISGTHSGDIINAYSTMVINNLSMGPNLRVGGIFGNSLNVYTTSNIYFAGKIQHSCTTSCEVGDIFGGGTAPVFTNVVVHADSVTAPSNVSWSGVDSFTEVNLTNESSANSRNTHFPSPAWVLSDGVFPRLAAELPDACVGDSLLSVTSQVANGRGSSADKPIVLCNRTQLLSMSGNYFYKLGTDLNVGTLTQNQTLTLDGELNGDHKRLLNISLVGSGAGDIGLFERINSTGAVKKLWLEGKVQGDVSQDRTGLLSGKNLGVIEDVVVEGSILIPFVNETPSTFHSVGLVAGFNSGIIKGAQAFGVLSSKIGIGGLVGHNLGDIKLSQARVEISPVGDIVSELGGLVATNAGTIEQSLSESRIDTLANGSSAASHFGGLVAINQASGVIENSYTGEDSEIRVDTVPYIGGLAGNNLGSISKSYSLTKSFVNGTFQSMQGGLVGDSSGSVSDSFYYFEAISEIGTVWETEWSTPSCSGNTFQVTVNNSNIDYNYSGSELLELRGSSSTEFMRVVSGVSFSWPASPALFSQSVDACATNMSFNDLVAYAEAPSTTGGSRVTSYTNLFAQATYTNWDIVLDSGGTSMDPRLVDFYAAEVNDQEHVNPPIWTLMPGEPPRLLQVQN